MSFPVNVPDVPGVPPVEFAIPGGNPLPALLTSDLVTQFSAVFGPQWGIFQDGEPVIVAESVVGYEFRADWTISDYPIEGGVFETYDKVQLPFLAKVRFASGSSTQARSSLLEQVDDAANSFELFDVVTPEFTYISASISHYDYRREAERGVGLVVVDVWLSQAIVQNTGGLAAGNVQDPTSADPVSGGTQTQQTSPSSASEAATSEST